MVSKVGISPEEAKIHNIEPTAPSRGLILQGTNPHPSEQRRRVGCTNILPEIITTQDNTLRKQSHSYARLAGIIEGNDLRLNLGSGTKSHAGFLNVDKVALENVDIIWNLEETPLPFRTNSVSQIICEHVLEHIVNYVPLLEELYRICKPGAKVRVMVPYFRYEAAYRDPTHVRFFTEHSFDYFQDGVEFSHYSEIRFDIRKVELRNTFKSSIRNLHKKIIKLIPFKKFLNIFLWNIFTEIYYELEVVK